MTVREIKIEETFLDKARERNVSLRFALANREKFTATIASATKYDMSVDSGGSLITLPKKEIFHITPEVAVLDEGLFTGEPLEKPAPTSRSRVQDDFLNRYIEEKTLALIHLTNGEELRAVVEGYDGFTLYLKTSKGQILLYKHGICSVGPGYRRHTGK